MKRKISIAGLLIFIMAVVLMVFVFGRKPKIENVSQPEVIVPDATPMQMAINSFAEFLLDEFDSTHTVGAAATVVFQDKVIFTGTYGIKKFGEPDSVDTHTVFRLASVSKGFAGVLACILEEKRKLSMDDRIVDYLDGFQLKDSVSTYGLKVRHILSHTSGLVPHAYDNLAEEGQNMDDIIPKFNVVDIAGPPGKYYGYQNVIFSLIDPVIKKKTGKTYGEHLQQKIFSPLGMEDASASFDQLESSANLAYPHYKSSGKYRAMSLNSGYYNLLPAAGVNASISDMGQWLVALLGYRPRVISREVCDIIASPVIYTPLKYQYTMRWDPFKERYYSLGWRIYIYKGRKIVYHGGYVGGYRAEIAFCPDEKTGIAFLQNSPNGMASKVVPAYFNLLFEELTTTLADNDSIQGL